MTDDKTDAPVLKLHGRVFITGDIRVVTGLHIGAEYNDLVIGGLDNPVIRNPINNQPYIPGSSLKGKLRSLFEKMTGAPQNKDMGTASNEVRIHNAENDEQYTKWDVNPIFGIPSDTKVAIAAPTRLIVRDVFLKPASVLELELLRTAQPYTEVKTEVAIDRITSKANPRSMERVPAGAVFSPAEFIFNIYQEDDVELLGEFLKMLRVLEDDFLGGQGSRGSGKIAFENLNLGLRSATDYSKYENFPDSIVPDDQEKTVTDAMLRKLPDITAWVRDMLRLG